MYVILDDQSRESFCTSAFLNAFAVTGPWREYSITTLSSERYTIRGRVAKGLKIRGVGQPHTFNLPPLNENDMIPNNKDEIPTLKTIESDNVLSRHARYFSDKDDDADVAILLGRDSGDLMYAHTEQKRSPFVYLTHLGYAVVGTLNDSGKHRGCDRVLKTCDQAHHSHFRADLLFPPPPTRGYFPGIPR